MPFQVHSLKVTLAIRISPNDWEGCSSEQVSLGAQKLDKTSQNSMDVEEFLAGLRFEQRNRLEGLQIDFL